MSTADRVPRRHSLLTKLLFASVAIVLLAVSATAWLAVRTATNAIQEQQGQSLAQTKTLYDQLQSYAATHRDWSGAAALVRSASARLGGRVLLTTTARRVLADSTPGRVAIPATPLATIDPLRPDPTLSGGSGAIDPRVVGPYRLNARQSAYAAEQARDVFRCLAKVGVSARAAPATDGRPVVASADDDRFGCVEAYDSTTFPTERRAKNALLAPTRACAGTPQDPRSIVISRNGDRLTFTAFDRHRAISPDRVQSCLQEARRAQLQPYAAPPALLFVTDSGAKNAHVTFPLTAHNLRQIALVTGGVLLVAVAITVLLSRRLTRPLRLLADSLTAGLAPQPAAVTGRDEIGRLAGALDRAMRRRDAAEGQRRELVADVAHELRNPLTNMRGWLESAQDGLTPVDTALVDLLHEETAIVQHILDDLADLAAADAGTLRLHPEPIDLGESLGQAVDAAASAADTAGVRVISHMPHPIGITADPIRVRQLVGNLISNAIRYTPPGGEVVVSTTATESGAVLEVADTGIGIAPENLPRVFDRFWRADHSRTRATGGSGLGLAIVRQLVTAHGGTVAVESTVGAGTRFTVRLPATLERTAR